MMPQFSGISDDDLLQGLHRLAGSQRRVIAELVLYLAEVDARRLYANEGFSSLFGYCVEKLCFSEDEACRRIEAARLTRRFPAIHELLKTGAVTLTVLGLLKPHMTPGNHRELLAAVSGSNVRQTKEWLAARFPQPDVPWSIRKHPERFPIAPESPAAARVHADVANSQAAAPVDASVVISPAPARVHADVGNSPAPTRVDADVGNSPAPTRVHADVGNSPAPTRVDADVASSRAVGSLARVEPLSRDRFLVKLTASRALKDKLELARDLMSHGNPSGDLAVVVERALDSLLAELEKTKLGSASRPERKRRLAKRTHVANSTRREVVARDGFSCSFVAPDGHRCGARAFLEFDHETPRGRGGDSEPQNVRLLCRTHNFMVAERVYGRAHMQRAASRARGDEKEGRGVRPKDRPAFTRADGRASWERASAKRDSS